jgi:hypothetical protein
MKKLIFGSFLFAGYLVAARIPKAPEVKEGDGPYPQLIIRGIISHPGGWSNVHREGRYRA